VTAYGSPGGPLQFGRLEAALAAGFHWMPRQSPHGWALHEPQAEDATFVVKGILLGTAMFGVSFMLLMAAFIWRKSLYHPKRSAGQDEIDFDVLTLVRHVFLHSPLFYAAFLGALLPTPRAP
jgi:hypothetical protein